MGSPTKTSSSTRETALSKQQASILAQREEFFQKFTQPAIQAELAESSGAQAVTRAAQLGVSDVNKSFASAERGFGRSAAQRGLAGSGFEASGLVGLQSAKSNALADQMLKARMATDQRRGQVLNTMAGLSPTPTTALGQGQFSETKPESIFHML